MIKYSQSLPFDIFKRGLSSNIRGGKPTTPNGQLVYMMFCNEEREAFIFFSLHTKCYSHMILDSLRSKAKNDSLAFVKPWFQSKSFLFFPARKKCQTNSKHPAGKCTGKYFLGPSLIMQAAQIGSPYSNWNWKKNILAGWVTFQ